MLTAHIVEQLISSHGHEQITWGLTLRSSPRSFSSMKDGNINSSTSVNAEHCIRVRAIITVSLSVAKQVQAVIRSYAQTLYALRTLWAHGMDNTAYRPSTVVIAKLFYASSATDQKRLVAFILWSQRSRFVPPNLPSSAFHDCAGNPHQLCRQIEKFTKALTVWL